MFGGRNAVRLAMAGDGHRDDVHRRPFPLPNRPHVLQLAGTEALSPCGILEERFHLYPQAI